MQVQMAQQMALQFAHFQQMQQQMGLHQLLGPVPIIPPHAFADLPGFPCMPPSAAPGLVGGQAAAQIASPLPFVPEAPEAAEAAEAPPAASVRAAYPDEDAVVEQQAKRPRQQQTRLPPPPPRPTRASESAVPPGPTISPESLRLDAQRMRDSQKGLQTCARILAEAAEAFGEQATFFQSLIYSLPGV